MLHAPLPEGAQIDGEVRLCLEADLHPDGTSGKEWMVVTEAQVLVFGRNGDGLQRRFALPLREISEPKAENFIGGGAFELLHNDERLELIRYTNGCMPSFAAAAGLIDKWVKGEEAVVPDEDAKRCPTCGFPLELGSKICPACTPKGQTLRRLLAYLKPHWPYALGLMLLSLVFAHARPGSPPICKLRSWISNQAEHGIPLTRCRSGRSCSACWCAYCLETNC